MTKYIYSFFFALTLMVAMPATVTAAPSIEIIEQEQQPQLTIIGETTLRVTNANGQTLYIYNVAGVRIQSIKVEGMDHTYELNLPKGCYIIKVGKTVRKVSVR